LIRALSETGDAVFSLAFSPDGRRLAATGVDRGGPPPFVLNEWDVQTGTPVLSLREPREIFATAFSPDGQWLALGLLDGTVKLADATTGQMIELGGKHKQEIIMGGVTFDPDGRRLASASNDGTVKVWDVTPAYQSLRGERGALPALSLETNRPLTVHSESGAAFWSVGFSPDGRRIVTGTQDGQLTIWETESGKQIRTVRGLPGGPYLAVAFTPDGQWVVSASGDCTARVWDAKTLEPIHTFRGHQGYIRCLAVSRDSKFLVTGSADKTVKVWDLTRLDKKTQRGPMAAIKREE
jgi:WD40 repeat protein